VYLMISRKPRSKNRGKTNRVKAKHQAKNRRRINRMRRTKLGKRLGKKW
jgi:hypothetical protein